MESSGNPTPAPLGRGEVDDVRSIMSFAGCLSPQGHDPQPSVVANYWLCPRCGLQIHWPVEAVEIQHKPPGEKILDRWAKK